MFAFVQRSSEKFTSSRRTDRDMQHGRLLVASRLRYPDGVRDAFMYLEHGKPFAEVDGVALVANPKREAQRRARPDRICGRCRGPLSAWTSRCAPPAGTSTASEIACTVLRERRVLSGVAGEAKAALCCRLWPLEEALIEALCTGFCLDPSRFHVQRPILEGERSAVFSLPTPPVRLLLVGGPGRAVGSWPRLRASYRGGRWAGRDSSQSEATDLLAGYPRLGAHARPNRKHRVRLLPDCRRGGPVIGPRRVRLKRSVPS